MHESVYRCQFPTVERLFLSIQSAEKSYFSGRMNFQILNAPPIHLFFVMGRLIWASGGPHRFRRWKRLMSEFCPELADPSRPKDIVPHPLGGEYGLLKKHLANNYLCREDSLKMIQKTLLEVLFDIVQLSNVTAKVSASRDDSLKSEEILCLIRLEHLFSSLEHQWKLWSSARLGNYSPNLSPRLKQADLLQKKLPSASYKDLQPLLQGQYSLRELAVITGQDLNHLSQVLVAYEQQDLIELFIDDDRQLPVSPSGPVPVTRLKSKQGNLAGAQPSAAQYMSDSDNSRSPILCIDDSPVVFQWLKSIVEPLGYRCIGVHEPVQALHIAIEEKPILIFIDLLMPILGGYELCRQMRRTSVLKDTPIIILTSSDKVVDRVRGKLAGANEYVTKPAPVKKVVSLVQYWASKQGVSRIR